MYIRTFSKDEKAAKKASSLNNNNNRHNREKNDSRLSAATPLINHFFYSLIPFSRYGIFHFVTLWNDPSVTAARVQFV